MKKFKDLVKQNPEPARGKSGTDPMDPWNAKSGIAEASEQALLNAYLKSRGINPKFVPIDTKISHSKSGEYLKWRQDHEFTEGIEILEATDEKDMVCFDIPLLIRVLEFTREDMKTDIELHNMVERLINMRETYPLTMKHYDAITQKLVKEESQELDEEELEEVRMKDIATDAAETGRLSKMSTLQKFRADAAARQKKHDDIEKNSGGMTSAIDRLEKHMNKEEVELDEMINEVLSKDASAGDWIHDFIHSDNPKFAGKSKAERKKMALGAYYGKQNEESEQIDEISKKTVKSWLKQQPVVPEKKSGMDKKAHNQKIKLRSKSWDSAIDRLTDRKPTSEEIEPIEEASKKEWSKSARMIKSLYKNKGVKEETYDFEKDDKTQGFSTGKKPKMVKTPENDNVGENMPDARAVMVGGKTMTGEKRDTVEIDPFLRKPKTNAPDAFDKPVGKKDY